MQISSISKNKPTSIEHNFFVYQPFFLFLFEGLTSTSGYKKVVKHTFLILLHLTLISNLQICTSCYSGTRSQRRLIFRIINSHRMYTLCTKYENIQKWLICWVCDFSWNDTIKVLFLIFFVKSYSFSSRSFLECVKMCENWENVWKCVMCEFSKIIQKIFDIFIWVSVILLFWY